MNTNFVKRDYYYRICDQIHEIKLNKDILRAKSKFPIQHVFLHGELKNLLTTLYIDKIFKLEVLRYTNYKIAAYLLQIMSRN
jgi:hypothetical protein